MYMYIHMYIGIAVHIGITVVFLLNMQTSIFCGSSSSQTYTTHESTTKLPSPKSVRINLMEAL